MLVFSQARCPSPRGKMRAAPGGCADHHLLAGGLTGITAMGHHWLRPSTRALGRTLKLMTRELLACMNLEFLKTSIPPEQPSSRAAEQPSSRAAEQPSKQPSSRAAEQAAEQPEQHNGQRAQSAAAVRWQRGGSGAAMHRQLCEELAVQNSTAEAELATAYGGHARGGGGGRS